jgi:hypothetical protein
VVALVKGLALVKGQALGKGQALAKGNFLRTLAKGCGEESPCKRVHVYRKQPLQKGVYRMQPLQVVYRPVLDK